MAWSVTDWTTKPVWQYATLVNEFVGAVNERKLALGLGSPLTTVNAGDDVQAATFFTQFQQWVETRLSSFVAAWAGGEALGAGWYDGAASIPVYASLAAVFTAAGLDHADWRRYTTHPDDGGEVAYGQMEVGDIIGPWIFEDIQKCLKVLVWTKRSHEAQVDKVYYYGQGYSGVSVAAAQAAAVAAWAEVSPAGSNPRLGAVSTTWDSPAGSEWWTELQRLESKFSVSNVWNSVLRFADWYVWADAARNRGFTGFQAYDPVVEDRWNLFSQDEPAMDSTTIISGTKMGDAATAPITPWAGVDQTLGWSGDSSTAFYYSPAFVTAVLRWNVEGGFTYQ